MKGCILLALLVCLALAGPVTGQSSSDVSITVFEADAPNAFGSPNYNDWVNNAITALETNQPSYGTPDTPGYFQEVSGLNPSQMIVTGFPSWMGQADPGTVFGSQYASELGNRPSFPVVIKGNGTKISISELSFTGGGNDPGNILGWNFGLGSYNYGSSYVGLIFNSDRTVTYVTSGSNTQPVDEIVGRGSGNADAAYCPSCSLADQQAAIAALEPDFAGMTKFSGTYTMTLPDGTVSGTGAFDVVPEPGTVVLLGIGLSLLGAGAIRKRRRQA